MLPSHPPPPSCSSHTRQDLAFLAVLGAFTAACLRDAYGRVAAARAEDGAGGVAGAGAGPAALWLALFQTNFWFLAGFGFLAYVLLPQILDGAFTGAGAGARAYVGWLHAGGAAAVPALVAFAAGRGKL